MLRVPELYPAALDHMMMMIIIMIMMSDTDLHVASLRHNTGLDLGTAHELVILPVIIIIELEEQLLALDHLNGEVKHIVTLPHWVTRVPGVEQRDK